MLPMLEQKKYGGLRLHKDNQDLFRKVLLELLQVFDQVQSW